MMSHSGMKGELIRGGVGTVLIKVLAIFLSFTLSVILARALGLEAYGYFSFYLSLATMAALPAVAGLPSLLIRECNKFYKKSEWFYARGLLKTANIFAFSVSIVIASILSLISVGPGNSEDQSIMFFALVLVPVLALTAVWTGGLKSLRRVVLAQLPEQIIRPLTLIVLISLLQCYGQTLNHHTAMLLYLSSALLALFVGLWLFKRHVPPELALAPAQYDLSHWARSWFSLFVYSATRLADAQLATLMLGFLSTPEDVGFYRVAFQVCSLIVFGLTVINLILSPQIAGLYAENKIKKIESITKQLTKIAFGWALLVAAMLIVWGQSIIGLLFGDDFISGSGVVIIIALAQLVNVALGSVGLVLVMTGHDKDSLKASFAGLIIGGLSMLILVPSYGHVGASIAFLTSTLAWNLISWVYLKKRLKINVSVI